MMMNHNERMQKVQMIMETYRKVNGNKISLSELFREMGDDYTEEILEVFSAA